MRNCNVVARPKPGLDVNIVLLGMSTNQYRLVTYFNLAFATPIRQGTACGEALQ